MRRRVFLAGASGVAVTAGCLSFAGDADRHPFADSTVTVRIDANGDTTHDLRANAASALEFWERQGPTYAGFEVEFEVVEREDADVVIAYDDDASGCEDVPEFREGVLGCAPVLGPETSVPTPVVARVVAGARPLGQVLVTAQHELGHVLGLGHEDEPRAVMSNRPEHRIPMYDRRVEVWEAVLDARSRTEAANDRYASGVASWNDGEYAAAGPAFEDAAESFAAAAAGFETATSLTDPLEGLSQPETVELDSVRALLDRLVTQSDLGVSAAETMVEAAAAAEAGDAETANARRGDANARIEEAGAVGPVELGDLAAALGLVRGVDREDAVVDLEDAGGG